MPEFTLSAIAYEVLQERLQLGTMHSAASVKYPYRAPERAHELANQAGLELRDRGLLDRGEPDPGLVQALQTLARPERACAAVLAAESGDRMFVVAAAERVAWFAEIRDDELHLRTVSSTDVAAAAVAALPPAPPGRGRPLVIRADLLDEQGVAKTINTEQSVFDNRNDPRYREADTVSRILHAPRRLTGQLTWQYSDQDGEVVTLDRPVAFIDLPDGRWSTVLQRDSTGVEWLTVSPATAETLTQSVHSLSQDSSVASR